MIWCQTLEGGAFDLLNPMPEMIDWRTVAIVLSRTSRFGGHTLLGPYSVAQHCVEGARAILRDTGRRDWAAAFLLHDVHEAFIGDIMTPVAKALEELASGVVGRAAVKYAIKELKRRIDCVVYEKAGLPFYWLRPLAASVVKEYDVRMALTERNERLSARPMPWHPSIESREPIEGCDLTPWGEALAAALWTTAFLELVRPDEAIDIPAPSEGCECDECVPSPFDTACMCSRCGAIGTLNSPPPPCDNCDNRGAGCGDDVVTPWASDPSGPAPIDFKGWPDSPAPADVADDYRKESEDIWR